MNNLLKVNYETEQPTVSARDLYEQLDIKTRFNDWFPRMCEYGFEESKDFYSKMSKTSEYGGRPQTDYNISIDMAKQICMIQRSPEGKQIRQYFLDLEKAWNTPEQIFARALKMADKTIDQLKSENATLIEDNERMKPHAILGHAIAAANTSILVGALAKILKQNGVETGQRRLFEWLRNNGYLIKQKGNDWNMPTQKSMEMGLFEIKESVHIDGNGCNRITRTPKVTGKGQQYFINKFLAAE
ncbi:phage antirepressor KilAC domain-containing protein [Anaerostipes hadrus]|uniref:phage antirepressor KilAC domain-containing protein n=1 Tax=Anaerostipes hadrus TaxID=649756 RepID=UPI001C031C77|nr:phage antirepressor KilAC domain-containing protein [Anaerostipes hadrus]MBT9939104.1 oxidoreductase [Anaerostipes hadrus]